MVKTISILVNYNYGPKARDLAKKILKYPSSKYLIIIDNASTDNSLKLLEDLKNKKILFIRNRSNLGYDKAVNQGIKKALSLGAEKIMLLDADLDFNYDLVGRLDKADADMVIPLLKFKRNNQWVYDYGGKVNWLLGRTTHLEEPSKRKINELIFPDFVSGGCTLIRRDVFKKIGLYDEDYFLYYGDTDFAIRTKRAGFRVAVDPQVEMIHNIAEHKYKKNWFKAKMSLQGNFVFITKLVPIGFKPVAYFYWLVLFIWTWWHSR